MFKRKKGGRVAVYLEYLSTNEVLLNCLSEDCYRSYSRNWFDVWGGVQSS